MHAPMMSPEEAGSLEDLLTRLKQEKGSDLHLACGIRPSMRRDGGLRPVEDWPVMDEPRLLSLLRQICSDKVWQEYRATHDVDFAYGIPGVARFRANYFRQAHGAGAVFRVVPDKVIPLEALKLPPAIGRLADLERGLVLVTGPTGSGKSTTLAAIIDRINATKSKHIVTIEDPVEFVHEPKKCVIGHREVGLHTESFAAALRSAVRQDADVILVGEMRDRETISLAITAAEMGTLVFGTLHTNSASKTVDRLIDAFPAEEQDQARMMLSESLAGVVAQLLLKTADGQGRCAINEILLKTPGLPNVIREGKTAMMASIIQSGKAQGMQSMDDALMEAVRTGKVRSHDAYLKAHDKKRFEALLK